jgi:uncharacterized protein (UPF0332 family)
MLGVRLNEDAGRAAYLAGFHAAQAFIFEDDRRFKHDLRIFLSQAYNLKSIADYEEGPGSEVSAERAAAAIETAARFIDCIAGLIGEGS